MNPGRQRSVARRGTKKQIPAAEAKEAVLGHIAAGLTREEAMAEVGRKLETFRGWMKADPEFKAEVFRLREVRAATEGDGPLPVPDFPEFCAELGMPMYEHQRRMWDAIQGRVPPDLDRYQTMQYIPGSQWPRSEMAPEVPGGRLILNGPPGFAKSTTFTVLWPVWLIHKNPNVRIIIVSKTQTLAVKQLGRISWYLTSSVNREIHAKYAPEGGWKDPAKAWTQTRIHVQGSDSGEKDPTVEALGIGSQIFGARADLIILDDSVILSNVNEYEKQIDWLEQEVESRLDGRGMLLLINTRVAPIDLFSELRNLTDWNEEPVYTYFSQPALLDEGDGTPETWVSLWPEGFPPARLRQMRRREDSWALVYQQQDVAEDATFNARAIEASVNGMRLPGPMTTAGVGHRVNGMDGLYVVGSLDPAGAGYTAMVVLGFDRTTEKRYVLDGFNQANCTPRLMKDTVKRFTDTYHIHEWVIEKNGLQTLLTRDDELTTFLHSRGCRLTPLHTTANNKYEADHGVASMANLFLTCGEPPAGNEKHAGVWRKTPETALIELPNGKQNAWVGQLMNQLVVWQPSGMKQLQKTDLVMALWFCMTAVDKIIRRSRDVPRFLDNPYASHARLRARQVVNLGELRRKELERTA